MKIKKAIKKVSIKKLNETKSNEDVEKSNNFDFILADLFALDDWIF